ncbi:MAG: M14 family metallopeptidase [Planctomycetota bacterium]
MRTEMLHACAGIALAALAFVHNESAAGAGGASTGAPLPATRPELSEFRETSSLEDVRGFLSALLTRGAPFAVERLGLSTHGRESPLVIVSHPPVANASDARRAGKLVIYLQANIHGGEVEGKEAAQVLLREFAAGEHRALLEHLVLLITPVYNCDGNENLAPGLKARAHQNGPDPIGARANGQDLDLNRDCMKARTPEMQAALAAIYCAWDPDAVIDLHTTNGTRHGYALTYSPPLCPGGDRAVLEYTRDRLLVQVRQRMRTAHGLETFDYGNVEQQDGRRAWYTFGAEPRYVTNYAGVRGRIGVLSEATSFLPFETRITATRAFVLEVLRYLAEHAVEVATLTRGADARATQWGLGSGATAGEPPPELGLRFDHALRGREPVLLERADLDPQPPPHAPPGALESVELDIYDRFMSTHSRTYPAAYFIPATLRAVVDLLLAHGVVVEELEAPWVGAIERFQVRESVASDRPFQGARLVRLEGTYKSSEQTIPAGSFLVRTAQPLGVLTFHLLEPESLDGASAWGFFDRVPAGGEYPLTRSHTPPKVATHRVPR